MNIVKLLRSYTGLSQSAFARHFGIPVTTFRKWEEGVRTPPDYLVMLITKDLLHDGMVGDGYDVIPCGNDGFAYCHEEDYGWVAEYDYGDEKITLQIDKYVRIPGIETSGRQMIKQELAEEIDFIKFKKEVLRRYGDGFIFLKA